MSQGVGYSIEAAFSIRAISRPTVCIRGEALIYALVDQVASSSFGALPQSGLYYKCNVFNHVSINFAF